ncbi:hypothetical protein J6590_062422 [Homalodisca vitripennis]|nr:hypothetical protein J6590_062422 [Homalodisca vitripennis]
MGLILRTANRGINFESMKILYISLVRIKPHRSTREGSEASPKICCPQILVWLLYGPRGSLANFHSLGSLALRKQQADVVCLKKIITGVVDHPDLMSRFQEC